MGITASPVSLEKGLKAAFIQASLEMPSYIEKIATVMPSDSDLETYGWLGQVPAVTEFLSERKIKPMLDARYPLVNKTWEATIAVKRNDLRDDKLGALPIRIGQMAQESVNHPQRMMMDTLINGTSATLGLCYDGGAFFSDTHPARGASGVIDNLLAGSGTTTAALKTDFAAAKAQLRRVKDEAGRAYQRSFGKFTVIAPPELELAFTELLFAPIISQTSNVMVAAAELIIAPELADTNDWYLLHTGGVLKPLIFQSREQAEFTALEGNSDQGFMRDLYLYGSRARYVGGFAMFQDANKTVN